MDRSTDVRGHRLGCKLISVIAYAGIDAGTTIPVWVENRSAWSFATNGLKLKQWSLGLLF
jgi:hypothetical protein